MHRYYFTVVDGLDVADAEGTELPDVAAVRREAIRYAGELLQDRSGEYLWAAQEWRMLVTDESGATILTLRVLAEH